MRLHGFIERIPKSHRYRVVPFGFSAALFLTRNYNRLLRYGLADIADQAPPAPSALRSVVGRLDHAIAELIAEAA